MMTTSDQTLNETLKGAGLEAGRRCRERCCSAITLTSKASCKVSIDSGSQICFRVAALDGTGWFSSSLMACVRERTCANRPPGSLLLGSSSCARQSLPARAIIFRRALACDVQRSSGAAQAMSREMATEIAHSGRSYFNWKFSLAYPGLAQLAEAFRFNPSPRWPGPWVRDLVSGCTMMMTTAMAKGCKGG
eukprot:371117-Rhodomonas_salina.1